MFKNITNATFIFLLTFTMFFITHHSAHAQEDNLQLWTIKTNDGNEYVGEIVLQTEKELKLRTQSLGTITLQLISIKKMEKVSFENIRNNEVWLENPEASRYFVNSSSYNLKKGEGYYQNVWVVFNQLTYGITDNFSLGVGTIPVFLFGADEVPIWLTPKVSIPVKEDELALGAGAFMGTVLGEDSSFGILYGTSTFGSREKNLTLGLGYGYVDGDFASAPTVTLSAMIRTGKRGYFITDNYFLSTGDDTVGILSFGGRRLWSNVALDYGGIIPINGDTGDLIIIPWLGISFAFGR